MNVPAGMNEWFDARIAVFTDRIEELERRIEVLEQRTLPMVRLGPTSPREDRPALDRVVKALEEKVEEERRRAEAIPVDRNAQTLTDGSPVTEDHREIISGGVRDGQQKGYVVLSAEERAKGFVRPLRDRYRHLTCNTTTTMGESIAETYARDPKFYDGTFCVNCKSHFPLKEFVWAGTNEQVGS